MAQHEKKGKKGNFTHFGFENVPVDKKADRVRLHFDSVASTYDFGNTLLSFGIHYLWKRTAIRMTNIQPGDQVIDVCGGTGDLSVLALKALSGSGKVFLYDINRPMIETGRSKRTNASYRKRIEYIQGNAEQISFPNQTFDRAMVGFGIRNLTFMENGFKEMYRILKPGGTLMCLEFSRPASPFFRRLYDFYSFQIMPWLSLIMVGSKAPYTYLPESIRLFPLPDELSSILSEIGFTHIRFRRLTNGIAVIHIATKG